MMCFCFTAQRAAVGLTLMLLAGCLVGCAGSAGHRGAGGPDFQRAGDPTPAPETLHALANILATQGRHPEAMTVLRRIMHEHPDYAPAYSKMAELYIQNDRPAEAEEVLARGLAVAPDDAVLHNNMGMCRMLAGDHEQALASFSEACRIAPRNEAYMGNQAAAMGMLGQYDEAIDIYLRMLPEHEAHHNLAVLCEARDDFERADEHRALAQSLQPKPARRPIR
ncbi:MAG: tetratricopeptide repeat protein [Phycisphaeraceae bacterium]